MEATEKTKRYIEAVGRRKTSVARVRMTEAGKSSFTVNEREFSEYFPTDELQKIAEGAVKESKTGQKFKVTATVKSGGISSQAGAVSHALARALVLYDENFRKALKAAGFLKRDARAKERRKFGLKKARKAPQWSKR
jgi:small subunit ribosomal protein S9